MRKPELRNSNGNVDHFYSSAEIFESVVSHAVFVYDKPWINRHAIECWYLCCQLRILDVTSLQYTLYAWKLPAKVKMSCLVWLLKANVLLTLVHGLPSRHATCHQNSSNRSLWMQPPFANNKARISNNPLKNSCLFHNLCYICLTTTL